MNLSKYQFKQTARHTPKMVCRNHRENINVYCLFFIMDRF